MLQVCVSDLLSVMTLEVNQGPSHRKFHIDIPWLSDCALWWGYLAQTHQVIGLVVFSRQQGQSQSHQPPETVFNTEQSPQEDTGQEEHGRTPPGYCPMCEVL